MTLFFILLIALVVYQFTTRRSLAQIYPQFSNVQIRRLSNVPFHFAAWTLSFVLCAYALSALTSMIGELFDVDNYISLFGGGWLGVILRFLRSNGFIDDIQEPMVLIQYRDTISTICTITLFSCIICGFSLIAYCGELKKRKLNKAAILTYYYLSMACGLTSYLLIMWGLYEFNELLNYGVNFHMEKIYLYLTLFFCVSCGYTLVCGVKEQKKIFALPQCEDFTWQQLFAKVKINTDKGQKPITDGQFIGIALGLSFLITGCVILSTLPFNTEAESELYEPMNTEEQEVVDPTTEETDIVPSSNDEICMDILRKYYTSNYDITKYGERTAFKTERFIQYTSCWDSQVLTSNQDFGIGDNCLKVRSIVVNTKLNNSYIVFVSCGDSEEIPTCVVMTKEGASWKIDNIAKYPYNKPFIDYSRPASDYYAYPDCGEGLIEGPDWDVIDEGSEMIEEIYKENEHFISL